MTASNAPSRKLPDGGVTTQNLQEAASLLRRALATLGPGSPINLSAITEAFAAVRSVFEARPAQAASAMVSERDDEYDRARAEYNSALKEWHQQLPRLRGWLLAEKARLETNHSHAQSVRSWLETNQQTK